MLDYIWRAYLSPTTAKKSGAEKGRADKFDIDHQLT